MPVKSVLRIFRSALVGSVKLNLDQKLYEYSFTAASSESGTTTSTNAVGLLCELAVMVGAAFQTLSSSITGASGSFPAFERSPNPAVLKDSGPHAKLTSLIAPLKAG